MAGPGSSACPYTDVEELRTTRPTPAAPAASSSRWVPSTLTATKSVFAAIARWGACRPAACTTASTPDITARSSRSSRRSPTTAVCGPGRRSNPTTSVPSARNSRTRVPPDCPELPVTTTRTAAANRKPALALPPSRGSGWLLGGMSPRPAHRAGMSGYHR